MNVLEDLDELSQILGYPIDDHGRTLIVAWEKARSAFLQRFDDPCEAPTRWRLPDERRSLTHRFKIPGNPGLKGYLTMGMYPSGRLGELFLEISKEGSFVSGVLDGFMTVLSIALQHGIPLHTFTRKLRGMQFEPAGMMGTAPSGMFGDGTSYARSILDYIARYLEFRFVDGILQR